MRAILLLAGLVWGCSTHKSSPPPPPTTPGPSTVPSDPGPFVTANNTHFDLGGKPFFFQGTNFYRLGLIDQQTDSEVYDIMHAYAAKQIKVVRIWGFSCGDGYEHPIVKSVTKGNAVYDEVALKRLDLTLDAARDAKVKIILTLINYEEQYCSMGWWSKQVVGVDDAQLFYREPSVVESFKGHVKHLLTRVNSIYQVRYGESRSYLNDPTIMAIELANEPHTIDRYEISHGMKPGSLVHDWLTVMSNYVRSLDPNHLISSGEEGYKASPSSPDEASRYSWLSNGLKGVDFMWNLSIPNVNFATVHPYPDHWSIGAADLAWFDLNFVKNRADLAHQANKPILLEETGYRHSYDDAPNDLAAMYSSANDAGYAGTMIWELVPPGTESGEFIYDFNSPIAPVVFRQADAMAGKNQ